MRSAFHGRNLFKVIVRGRRRHIPFKSSNFPRIVFGLRLILTENSREEVIEERELSNPHGNRAVSSKLIKRHELGHEFINKWIVETSVHPGPTHKHHSCEDSVKRNHRGPEMDLGQT